MGTYPTAGSRNKQLQYKLSSPEPFRIVYLQGQGTSGQTFAKSSHGKLRASTTKCLVETSSAPLPSLPFVSVSYLTVLLTLTPTRAFRPERKGLRTSNVSAGGPPVHLLI